MHIGCVFASNLDGCSPQQRKLYTQLLDLLKDGHLAKLACEDVRKIYCMPSYFTHTYIKVFYCMCR